MRTLKIYTEVKQICKTSAGVIFTRKECSDNEIWADKVYLFEESDANEIINRNVYYCRSFKDGFI